MQNIIRTLAQLTAIGLLASVGTLAAETMKPLIDFSTRESVETWQCVNDTVMGGVSRSALRWREGGTAVLTGTVSLENNGGFASARTGVTEIAAAAFAGVVFRVKGDGKKYSFRIRADEQWDGVSQRAEFDTRPNEWMEIRLPFARFAPTYRGRILNGQPPLATQTIHQVGFLIADQQAGDFALEIDWIRLYTETETDGIPEQSE